MMLPAQVALGGREEVTTLPALAQAEVLLMSGRVLPLRKHIVFVSHWIKATWRAHNTFAVFKVPSQIPTSLLRCNPSSRLLGCVTFKRGDFVAMDCRDDYACCRCGIAYGEMRHFQYMI